MGQNNLILVEQNFRTNDHDLNRGVMFTTIEWIEKDINIKSIIEKKKTNKQPPLQKKKTKTNTKNKKEDKWIKSLKTYEPFGFNMKLNYPTSKE